MGIDLKVIASQFREARGEFLATASLRLERDMELFGQLSPDAEPRLVSAIPAGLKVGHYEEAGLVWVEVDRYGSPLTFTTPAALVRLRLPEGVSAWNRAILAFLLSLPHDARVVLYWC
jgi:hypothetical protein